MKSLSLINDEVNANTFGLQEWLNNLKNELLYDTKQALGLRTYVLRCIQFRQQFENQRYLFKLCTYSDGGIAHNGTMIPDSVYYHASASPFTLKEARDLRQKLSGIEDGEVSYTTEHFHKGPLKDAWLYLAHHGEKIDVGIGLMDYSTEWGPKCDIINYLCAECCNIL